MNVVTYIRNPSDPKASHWTFCTTWWEFVWKIGQVVTKGELHLTFPLDQAGGVKNLQKTTNTTYMKSAALSTRVCDWDQWVCSFGQRGGFDADAIRTFVPAEPGNFQCWSMPHAPVATSALTRAVCRAAGWKGSVVRHPLFLQIYPVASCGDYISLHHCLFTCEKYKTGEDIFFYLK